MKETLTRCYQTLGLEPGADAAAVKKAYFRLVRLHPPEKEPEKFQEIRQAYEALKDGPPIEEDTVEGFAIPEDPGVLYLLNQAKRLMDQEDEKGVVDCFSEALKLAPDDPFLLLILARLQRQTGNPRKSANTAKRLQKAAPDCAEAYALAATGFYAGGWYKKAYPEFKKALALGYAERSFLIDYADAADANGEHETASRQRAALLRDTKWDRDNVDEALYLFGEQLGHCVDGEEALPTLEEYGRFLRANRRILREYGLELLGPFMEAAVKKHSLARFQPFYRLADELVTVIGDMSDGLDAELIQSARGALLQFAFDGNPAFSDDWAKLIVMATPPSMGDSRAERFLVLDALLCLMKEREKNLPLIPVIRRDYPYAYTHIRTYCEQLASDKAEEQTQQLKREYARLSEQYEGGDYYERYPEEKPLPRGVVAYSDDKPFVRETKKPGRNDPCPCGSGLKFKRCCLGKGIYD